MVDAALLHKTITEYEALDERRQDIQKDQAEVLKAAEEGGLDKPTVKRLIRELRRDEALMRAQRETLDDYREAYLTFEATPLGAYAKGKPEPTDGVSQLKRARVKKGNGDAAKNAEDEATAAAELEDIKAKAAEQARPEPMFN